MKKVNIKFKGETDIEASRRLGGNDKLVFKRLWQSWDKRKAFNTKCKK